MLHLLYCNLNHEDDHNAGRDLSPGQLFYIGDRLEIRLGLTTDRSMGHRSLSATLESYQTPTKRVDVADRSLRRIVGCD
jgi:hypothetical protein